MPDYSEGKIYKVVNSINSKVYIGSTCQSLYKRMSAHRTCAASNQTKLILWQEIRDIGIEYFTIVLIEALTMCESREELVAREYEVMQSMLKRKIVLLNTRVSPQHAESSLAKLSAAKMGKKHSAEHIEQNRQSHIGHRRSKSSRKKQSESTLGSKHHRFSRGSVLRYITKKDGKEYASWRFKWRQGGKQQSKGFGVTKWGGDKSAHKACIAFQNTIYPIA